MSSPAFLGTQTEQQHLFWSGRNIACTFTRNPRHGHCVCVWSDCVQVEVVASYSEDKEKDKVNFIACVPCPRDNMDGWDLKSPHGGCLLYSVMCSCLALPDRCLPSTRNIYICGAMKGAFPQDFQCFRCADSHQCPAQSRSQQQQDTSAMLGSQHRTSTSFA